MGAGAERCANLFANIPTLKIPNHCDHVLILHGRIQLRYVDPDHTAFRAHDPRRHLEPATRPAAQIDHSLSGSEELLPLLNLEQLVGRARAIALALGALVEGILAVVVGNGSYCWRVQRTALRTRTMPSS